jgi:hypothetical protein
MNRGLRSIWPALAVFVIGLAAAAAFRMNERPSDISGLRASPPDSTMAVVLVVSPTCAACNDPSLPDAWATIASRISQPGAYRIGVATSGLADDGLRFLGRFGEFHEALAGGGWGGTGALHYIFRELSGPATVPQVIVMERRVVKRPEGVSVHERVIQRRVGVEEVLQLARELGTEQTRIR